MSSKESKLSLKKKSGKASVQPVSTHNTIVSMFKKQEQRQSDVHLKNMDADDDVCITKVSGLDKSASSSSGGVSVEISDTQHKPSSTQHNKLSLSSKKRSNIAVEGKPDSACSDDKLKIIEPSRKRKRNLGKSKSVPDGTKVDTNDTSRYKLRKRNTVPIVDISDSEENVNDPSGNINNGNFKPNTSKLKLDGKSKLGKKSGKYKPKSNNQGDLNTTADDVIVIKVKCDTDSDNESIVYNGTDIETCKYFDSGGKRKVVGKTNRKLSLKRIKLTEEHSDVSKLNSLPSSNETSRIDQTEFKSHDIISNDSNVRESPQTEKLTEKSSNKHRKAKSEKHSTNITGDKNEFLVLDRNKSEKSDKRNANEKSCDINTNEKSRDKSKRTQSERKGKKENAESSSGYSGDLSDSGGGDGPDKMAAGQSDTELPDSNDITEYKVPYYLENFKMIIQTMLKDGDNARLFDDDDMMCVNTFNSLQESSQKLYVRLFSRKLKWLSVSKVIYPEISEDIPSLLDELTAAKLLYSEEELNDLPTVLKILSAPDLKLLAKSFHINCTSLTKNKIIEQLLKKGQQSSISALFKGGNKGIMENTIITRAKSYLGKACRLNDAPRTVFIRLLMLFSLYNTNFDEESGAGGQNQLFQMLMVNIGRVVYPTYVVNKQTSIFHDRAALVRFETALQFEMDIQNNMDQGKWKQAHEIYQKAKVIGDEVCHNKQYISWDSKLPQFLRFYTAGSIYVRIDSHGVEILQRLKMYQDAVNLLEGLLKQEIYCEHYRGHWYERLALNLEAHLKSVNKSFSVLKRGLSDDTVPTGRRLALYERARKICEAPKSKYADRICEFIHDPVQPTPEVTIEGMVMSDATSVGMKYQFVMQGNTDSVTFCAVEELVLEHYKQNGYPEGLHAEGSIISNLFVLLFWDIMFMNVPDVFHGPYQSCPLDMTTRDFYENRKHLIDERLQWLRTSHVDELVSEVHKTWEDHSGKMCSGINWEKFTTSETHQNLVSCMGGAVIAGILERYVKDPRHTRSGFPDLTLWNTETKQFKICEVKGPNDRLSYKQILWIDYLLKLGVDAEVCYVKAVGSKKLKPMENTQ